MALLSNPSQPAFGQTRFLELFLIHVFVLVNRIKELHKVTVRIPPDNEKSNLIRIEGDPQGVQEAKKELLELASRMVGTNPRAARHNPSPARTKYAPLHRRTSVQRT